MVFGILYRKISETRRKLGKDRQIEDIDEVCKILEVSNTNLGVMLFRLRNRVRECLEAKWGQEV